jgi:hypothetical protein
MVPALFDDDDLLSSMPMMHALVVMATLLDYDFFRLGIGGRNQGHRKSSDRESRQQESNLAHRILHERRLSNARCFILVPNF